MIDDFVERHWWAQVVALLVGTFAISFVIVWFPYGFIMGDLTIDPMKWSADQRGCLVAIWLPLLALLGLSAAT